MFRKLAAGFTGALLGFLAGFMGGGFLGLVLGGTFLGWLELPGYPNLPGYELTFYAGALLGILILTPLGLKMALRIAAARAGRKEPGPGE